MLERLDDLDDAVINAIRGDRAALNLLRGMWDDIRRTVDEDLLDESRAQYLQYALSLWLGDARSNARNPEQAVSAMDVLCLLFDEALEL